MATPTSPTPQQMAATLYDIPAVPQIARSLLWRILALPNARVSRGTLDVLELLWVEHVLPERRQQDRLAAQVRERLDSLVAEAAESVAASVAAEEQQAAEAAARAARLAAEAEAERLRRAVEVDELLPCSCGRPLLDCDDDVVHRARICNATLLRLGYHTNLYLREPPEARVVPSFCTTEAPQVEATSPPVAVKLIDGTEPPQEAVIERVVVVPVTTTPKSRQVRF